MRVVITVDGFGFVNARSGNVWLNTCISGDYENSQFYVSDESQYIAFLGWGRGFGHMIMDIPDLPVPKHLKADLEAQQ